MQTKSILLLIVFLLILTGCSSKSNYSDNPGDYSISITNSNYRDYIIFSSIPHANDDTTNISMTIRDSFKYSNWSILLVFSNGEELVLNSPSKTVNRKIEGTFALLTVYHVEGWVQ
jgi:hypothetical protein